MTIRTITKFACFVISLFFCQSCANVSFGGSEHAQIGPQNAGFKKAEIIARISSKEINESSGLAVSKCQDDVFWTHNDSGDGPFIYAINSNGESLGTFRLPNVNNVDWEDMATIKSNSGECFLYIGEIGDNERKRDVHAIYRIKEPLVSVEASGSSRKDPVITSSAEILRFSYSDGRHNSETLLVDPRSGVIYAVTKEFAGPASVFRVLPNFVPDEVQTVPKIATISLPATPNGLVTGGDISPDGNHIVLCDYFAGYELVLSPAANDLSNIWDQKPEAFDLGPREIGEAVAYGRNAETVYATTERPNAPLIRVQRGNK